MTILSLPVASRDPANLFPSPDTAKEQPTTVTSGRKCLELFGRFPRAMSWQKTFAACLVSSVAWYSRVCVLTWRLSATKYNRLLFRLVPSMRLTAGTEFGLLLWLPTPQAADCRGGVRNRTPETANGNLDDYIEGLAFRDGITSRLSPLFSAEMMGYPTDWLVSPFQAGDDKA